MPLYLTEADVTRLLTMKLALSALEEVCKARSQGKVANIPRARIPFARGSYNIMSASWSEKGVVGHKSYAPGGGVHVALYGTNGEGLLALIEASRMGQVRTGAASGIATKYMARQDATTAGVIGSGYQAETQLEAIAAVRKLKAAKVFSRTPEKRNAFADTMSARLGIEVLPVGSAADAARDVAVIAVITNASDPVLTGDMLSLGTHINAAGGNSWTRRELDTAVVQRSAIIATDDVEQARIECADLMRPATTGHFLWETLIPIEQIVAGLRSGRDNNEQITLFESQGVAYEDIAVCERLYHMALEQGVGTKFP